MFGFDLRHKKPTLAPNYNIDTKPPKSIDVKGVWYAFQF